MIKKLFLSALTVLAIQLALLSPATANDCADNAYGGSTLRGDAQYPPGWLEDASAIEITRPDEFVYGVIDGSVLPQQFLHIKAKLRNRLDRQMNAGTLRAAARYRKQLDYQPDLSANPPTLDSLDKKFSASLSEPISIDSLASDLPQTFAFDFSNEPIPAGITDLYFIVIFKGEIEGYDGPAVAVGIKDLNEPTHIAIWNLNDHYCFNQERRTAESFLNNQADYDWAMNNCWSFPAWIDWDRVFDTRLFGFSADHTVDAPVYVVKYRYLQPGHYGRIIVLLDVGRSGSYCLLNQEYFDEGGCSYLWEVGVHPDDIDTSGPCTPSYHCMGGAVVNQQSENGFETWETLTSRQYIKSHVIRGLSWFCNYSASITRPYYESLHREVPPANDQPATAVIINFP